MNILLLKLVLFLSSKFCVAVKESPCPSYSLQEKRQNFTEMAETLGYKTEYYKVVTEDSYILALFRIRGSIKPPTLLIHGLLDSADTWILRGENSFGFAMARQGHDVWFANCRGNYYSRSHLFLDPDKDPSFWDFSFHDLGYYDLPSLINTILVKTHAKKLNLIGHSQGNTILYVLGSTRPDYNDKINVAIALSPVCYFNRATSLISSILKHYLFTNAIQAFNLREFFEYNGLLARLFRAVCKLPVLGYELCSNLLFFLSGDDVNDYEMNFHYKLISHFPAGTSAQSVVHFEQVAAKKKFANYDYGRIKNLQLYKSPTPIEYNLTNIRMPVVLLAAKNDFLSSIPDVELLWKKLPNVVDYVQLPRRKMNHLDFVWGRNAKTYLFPYIFKALHNYG